MRMRIHIRSPEEPWAIPGRPLATPSRVQWGNFFPGPDTLTSVLRLETSVRLLATSVLLLAISVRLLATSILFLLRQASLPRLPNR